MLPWRAAPNLLPPAQNRAGGGAVQSPPPSHRTPPPSGTSSPVRRGAPRACSPRRKRNARQGSHRSLLVVDIGDHERSSSSRRGSADPGFHAFALLCQALATVCIATPH
ncbi:hypothetical protein MRX96_054678 [Rhipicephalus microplus]